MLRSIIVLLIALLSVCFNACRPSSSTINKSQETTLLLLEELDRSNQERKTECTRIIMEANGKLAEGKSIDSTPQELLDKLQRQRDQMQFIMDLSRKHCNQFTQFVSDLIIATSKNPMLDTIEGFGDSVFYQVDSNDEFYKLASFSAISDQSEMITLTQDQITTFNFVERLNLYRDSLLMTVCNYMDIKAGREVFWKIALDQIKLESNEPKKVKEFNQKLNAALKNVNPKDVKIVKEIIELLTLPEKVLINGVLVDWSDAKINNSQLLYGCSEIIVLKTLIIQAELLAMKLYNAKKHSHGFTKLFLELVPTESTVISSDSLRMRFRLYLDEDIYEVPLRYWIDDSNKSGEPILGFIDKTEGNIYLPNLSSGKHIIYGDYKTEDLGKLVWKSWKTEIYIE